jgi:hypothetical protein
MKSILENIKDNVVIYHKSLQCWYLERNCGSTAIKDKAYVYTRKDAIRYFGDYLESGDLELQDV